MNFFGHRLSSSEQIYCNSDSRRVITCTSHYMLWKGALNSTTACIYGTYMVDTCTLLHNHQYASSISFRFWCGCLLQGAIPWCHVNKASVVDIEWWMHNIKTIPWAYPMNLCVVRGSWYIPDHGNRPWWLEVVCSWPQVKCRFPIGTSTGIIPQQHNEHSFMMIRIDKVNAVSFVQRCANIDVVSGISIDITRYRYLTDISVPVK
jgi:hypothetical protein